MDYYVFCGSVVSIANTPGHKTCISLNNQQSMTQATLINLHPNEYIEGLRYYPFALNLDRCMGSCSTPNGLSNRICASNETADLNLNVFNMITGINESKI